MKKNENGSIKKLLIIHFQPVELYPPVLNLLECLRKYENEFEVIVITNKSNKNLSDYNPQFKGIKIKRVAKFSPSHSFVRRFFGYCWFYIKCVSEAVKFKPGAILYIESLSALPAIIYKLIFNRKTILLAHYHEYTSPEEYRLGMVFNRINHWLEKKYYRSFSWISHTNEIRLIQFRSENDLQNEVNIQFEALPNYPPEKWLRSPKSFRKPLQLVMLGTIGYKTMYLKEVIEWVKARPASLNLTFISHTFEDEALQYLKENEGPNIHLMPGIDYLSVPDALDNFDVGLVIYKPHSYNTINAVSNKVFEYLICGLDVWFPHDMTGTLGLVTKDSYPKIISLDYSQLSKYDPETLVNRDNLHYKPSEYYNENVYPKLIELIRLKLSNAG